MANEDTASAASPKGSPSLKTNGAARDTAPPPSPRSFNGFSEITRFIWGVADLLRGDYKQADYGKVILPLTVLRRLDCVLEKTKAKVLAKHAELKQAKHAEGTIEKMLLRASGTTLLQHEQARLREAEGRPEQHRREPDRRTSRASRANARDVIEQFKFAEQIAKLDESNLLFQVVSRFADVDLHPDKVPEPRDGLDLRGADPEVRRSLERDSRRALHAARGHPPDGGPPLHRGRRDADAKRASYARSTIPLRERAACFPSPRSTCAS